MLFEFPPAVGMLTANLTRFYMMLIVCVLTGAITFFAFLFFFHIFIVLLLIAFQMPRDYLMRHVPDYDRAV